MTEQKIEPATDQPKSCEWCGRYETRHMDAYYYGFDKTGVAEVDHILCSVASAGKAYHSTEEWNEGGYPALIQKAADIAAARIAADQERIAALHTEQRALAEDRRESHRWRADNWALRKENANLRALTAEMLKALKSVASMAVSWQALTPRDIAEVFAIIEKAEAARS